MTGREIAEYMISTGYASNVVVSQDETIVLADLAKRGLVVVGSETIDGKTITYMDWKDNG